VLSGGVISAWPNTAVAMCTSGVPMATPVGVYSLTCAVHDQPGYSAPAFQVMLLPLMLDGV
jgi:hypothetical protein